MFKKGDEVILHHDDQESTQEILGKTLVVLESPSRRPPYWVRVRCEGKTYLVKGSNCKVVN